MAPLAPSPAAPTTPKARILILSSRGVTYRHRHLLNDLLSMLPHSRKDAKLDSKSPLSYLNEVAELHNCSSILFFDARKRADLYLWLSRAPSGPCIKFHIQNLHTMSELNFTGNALKGSRALVSFDKNFDLTPAAAVIKELLQHTFSVPRNTRKSKPFTDRVVSFTYADGKVWMRHYQIQPITSSEEARVVSSLEKAASRGMRAQTEEAEDAAEEESDDDNTDDHSGVELIEIGPRFVMTPTVILEGSFGGPKVFENKEFVSADSVRREIREKRTARMGGRDMVKTKRSDGRGEAEREKLIAKVADINNELMFDD